MNEYEIMAEIGCGMCLPDEKKYKIKITINDYSMITDNPVEVKPGYCRWNKRFDMQTMQCVYTSHLELDNVYVYLMEGNKPICFYKGECTDFENPDPTFQWFAFKNDLAIGSVKDSYKAGLFSMKLSIHHKTKNGPCDFKQFNAWKKPPPKRLSSWKIRAYIY